MQFQPSWQNRNRRARSAGGSEIAAAIAALRNQASGAVSKPVIDADGLYGQSLAAGRTTHSLVDYISIIWRRKYVLLAVVAICTITAFAVARGMRPVYRAAISVMVDKRQEPASLATESPADEAAAEIAFQTKVGLLQSKSLIRRVSEKLTGTGWSNGPRVGNYTGLRELEFVSDRIKVIPTKGTRLIEIQVEAHDPQLAAAFANSLVAEHIALEREEKWKRDKSDREWLESQVATLKQNIENSERTLFSFARGTDAGLALTSDKSQDSRVMRLQDELSKAQVDRFSAAARYELATKSSTDTHPEQADSPALREYQGKLLELHRQLAEAKALWTSDHPKVKQLQAQVGVFTNAIQSERDEVSSRLKGDYLAALRKEQLLSGELLNASRALTDRENKAVHYSLLKRDLDRDRELYDAIVHRVKQVNIAAGLSDTAIRLVDAAEPPLRPTRPNVPLISGLALVSSIFLGVIVVLVREQFGSTVEWPGESTGLLNLNELGVIPSQRPTDRALRSWWPAGMGAALLTDGSVELAMLRESASTTAQCFRGVIASVLFLANEIQTIVVTSAAEGEGKTTVVSNVGLVLARMGKTVLFIDADHRRPRLHTLFGVTRAGGLRELLEGTGPIMLRPYVSETKVKGLHLLQSSRTDPREESTVDFPELLLSKRITQLMETARQEYDFILIDTPPLMQLHDSRVWARLADGVLFVVRAGETNKQQAVAAVSTLAKDGANVLGTILNDLPTTRMRCYDYYPAAQYRSS